MRASLILLVLLATACRLPPPNTRPIPEEIAGPPPGETDRPPTARIPNNPPTATIPNNRPTATITAPAGGSSFPAGTSVTFTGTGTDPEDGALSGASLLWTSDLDGKFGTGASVTTSGLSIGVHTITLTVTDSDGGADVHPITVPITNNLPAATITAPAGGSSFPAGTSVTFTGTGTDLEDGALSGASLVWTSDLDGELGTGESVTATGLSIGVHTITLTVADSNGGSNAHPITVPIVDNPPPPATPESILERSEDSEEVQELRALGPSYIPNDHGPETVWNTDAQAMLTRTLLPVLREQGLAARTSALYWVLIREDGTAAEVVVQTSSGNEAFDLAGMQVIRRLDFLPAFRANRPVPTWVVREISLLMQ